MKKLLLILLLPVTVFGQVEDVRITADGTVINTKTVKFATGKLMVNGVAVVGGGITSVTGTAPIVSSGGTTPAISITAATTGAPGSMSASDKAKLDGISAGAQPGTVTSVAVSGGNGIVVSGSPITTSGTITLSLGAITPASVNGLTLTAAGTGWTIAGGTTSKTLTLSNTMTLAGTDGSTLNIGTGGTLGTAAFTSSGAYQPIDLDLTSWALITRASGFDTFATTPTLANLDTLVSDGNLVATTRAISTTSPLTGGGDLSANRTFAIDDAAANGVTKGAATFTGTDFNATAGVVSIDYNNGQAASGSVKGFITAADWLTFDGKQASDADLTALAALSGTNTIYYRSAANTWSAVTPGANMTFSGGTLDAPNAIAIEADPVWAAIGDLIVGRGNDLALILPVGSNDSILIADSSDSTYGMRWGTPASVRTALGLVIGTNVQAFDADLTTYAGISPSANVQTLLGAASFSAFRTSLTLVPGTDVQAFDADLLSWAGVTRASGFDTFTTTPSSANLDLLVTDDTGTGALVFANTPTLVAPILGTPTSGTLTNATGLPIGSGVSGLASGIATFLGASTSANFMTAITDETGSGLVVAQTAPTIINPKAQASSGSNPSLILNGTAIDASVDNTNGIMLTLSHNGTDNRQIIFGDSAGIGDSSKTSFRFIVGITDVANIDGISNNGATAKSINLGGPTPNVCVGCDPGSITQAGITSKLQVEGVVRTTTGFTNNTVTWTSGSGSPEGVVTAPIGSLFSRTNGGAATSLYVKESGAGNTGWIGK